MARFQSLFFASSYHNVLETLTLVNFYRLRRQIKLYMFMHLGT